MGLENDLLSSSLNLPLVKSRLKCKFFIDSWEKDGIFFVKHFHMVLAKENHPSGSKTRPHIFFFAILSPWTPFLGLFKKKKH